jgi:purine-nucleoside phosphorylase
MILEQLAASKKFLQQKTRLRPQLGFVLGSGLSGFGKHIDVDVEIPFSEIPHYAGSTVEGHPGRLLIGTLNGVEVAVQMGRLHAYEGLSFEQVVFPVRTLANFGLRSLVVTNAAGGLKKTMRPGDFMLINDHINFTGANPLCGPNLSIGPRFVDMSEPYDSKLSGALKAALRQERVRFTEGVYIGVLGPSFETAAEVRLFGRWGGGTVGMSTVSEVIAARHAGLRVVGLSCVTNLGTGLSKKPLSHDDVKEVAAKVEEKFARTLVNFTARVKDLQ